MNILVVLPKNLLNGGFQYNKQISPVHRHFVKLMFHCRGLEKVQITLKNVYCWAFYVSSFVFFFFTVLMQQFSALHRFVLNSCNPLSQSNQYQSMSVISC